MTTTDTNAHPLTLHKKLDAWLEARTPRQSFALVAGELGINYTGIAILLYNYPVAGLTATLVTRPVRWAIRGYLWYKLGPNLKKSKPYNLIRNAKRRFKVSRPMRKLGRIKRKLFPKSPSL